MRCAGLTRGSSVASYEASRYNRSKIAQGNHRKTGNALFFRFTAIINNENTNGTNHPNPEIFRPKNSPSIYDAAKVDPNTKIKRLGNLAIFFLLVIVA